MSLVSSWSTKCEYEDVHRNGITDMVLSESGKHLYTAGGDCVVTRWETKNLHTAIADYLGHELPVLCLALSVTEDVLFTGSEDRTIRCWNVATVACLQTYKGHELPVMALALSRCRSTLWSASCDATIREWDVVKGECRRVLSDGHTKRIECLTLSRSGDVLISGGFDGQIVGWKVEVDDSTEETVPPQATGVRLGSTPAYEVAVISIELHSNGHDLYVGYKDGLIRQWEVSKCAKSKCVQDFKGHTRMVTGLRISADSTRLHSVSLDKTFCIWDTGLTDEGQGQCTLLQTCYGHMGQITELVLNNEGRVAYTCAHDRSIREWFAELKMVQIDEKKPQRRASAIKFRKLAVAADLSDGK
ncbi:hypothetical protein CYMTET_18045 [Cymbomonas tetramitiformis]|uniref:Uncharacterized protein n=1 Tax=Cymbomonas tetramitiformis TaxID=36881 RepID=A0AAE0G915_9CHLO|nr:hypothetical protein CYMTET_18045 [Cymbomonas tetramitiformis]